MRIASPVAAATRQLPRLRDLARRAHVSPATAFAIRYATATSAAIWLGHAPGLVDSNSDWILISALMVMQPVSGGSLLKAILRSFGTLAAFFIAILLFGLFSQDPPLLLAGLFLVQALGAYGFTGPRGQYAWFVFAFTTGIILGDALSDAGQVETVAFERASMVGLGILIVLVVDAVFWPTRSEESLRRSLAERARRLSRALRRAVEAPPDARDQAAAGSASSPLAGQLSLADTARSQIGVSHARVEALRHVALLLETLASRERVLRARVAESGSRPEAERFAAVLGLLGSGVEAALEESAQALVGDRGPTPFATDLEQAVMRLETESAHSRARGGTDAALQLRAAGLHDLVALLRTLEGALVRLASESAQAEASGSQPVPAAIRFRLDPFRVQIALRTGIAVCAAWVLVLVLGWGFNNLIPPLAFMIASTPTRGGAVQGAVSLAVSVLLGWLLADLASVFFSPYVGRLPLGLLWPFAVAGAFAYASASRPELDGLRKLGTLVALLPVFAGEAAPTDVEGAYDTVCYAGLAAAVGWVSTRLLWPATAAMLFRERAAAQLELCREALWKGRLATDRADRAPRRQRAAELLAAYTKQVAQLGSLHGQARREPVEQALHDERRVQLLALTQDLFDAVLSAPDLTSGQTAEFPEFSERGGGVIARLREALARMDEALLASMQNAAEGLRDAAATSGPDLAEARDAVEELLDELRSRPELHPALDPQQRAAFLVQLDSRRQLVRRQLAVEAWGADWYRAGAADTTAPVHPTDHLAYHSSP